MLAFLLGGIVLGYISYGRIFDGFINGALMGMAGAVILWIINIFDGQIIASSVNLIFYFPSTTTQSIIILMVLGSIGGAIGALILRLNRKNRKYDRKIIEDRDRRDDLYWRD
jgi:H+/Cl- antiporter ClcA